MSNGKSNQRQIDLDSIAGAGDVFANTGDASNAVDTDEDFAPKADSGQDSLSPRNKVITVVPQGFSRGQVVAMLSREIPRNDYGLPIFYIRSDLLQYNTHVTQEIANAASVPLTYSQGYPVTPDGYSFWSQMPHEPANKFVLFQKYLDQAEELGIRQLDQLAATTNTEMHDLLDLSREFYWGDRCTAYDMFHIAADFKRRELRTMKMENTHFEQAAKLLEPLVACFEETDEDGKSWVEDLTASEALEALEKLFKIQRLSVGLTGQHASSNSHSPAPRGSSPEHVISQIAKGAGLSQQSTDNFLERLKALTADDGDGVRVSEAIVRLTAPDNKREFSDHGAALE